MSTRFPVDSFSSRFVVKNLCKSVVSNRAVSVCVREGASRRGGVEIVGLLVTVGLLASYAMAQSSVGHSHLRPNLSSGFLRCPGQPPRPAASFSRDDRDFVPLGCRSTAIAIVCGRNRCSVLRLSGFLSGPRSSLVVVRRRRSFGLLLLI